MEIIFAGFGGQGVLTSGQVMAYIAMSKDYEVMWSPAYGGQMRGGKAYSLVKYQKDKIGDPGITKADVLVAMNEESLDFVHNVKPDGTIIINSDVIDDDVEISTTAKVIRIHENELALQSGSARAANIVTVGAVIHILDDFERDEAMDAMCSFFEKKGKGKLKEGNKRAFLLGYEGVVL